MRKHFYSLRSRIFIAIVSLLIPSSISFGWLSIHQQTEALIEQGKMSARHLAYGAELAILTEDSNGLKSLVHKSLQEKNALFVEIYDAQGALLAAASTDSSAVDDSDDTAAANDISAEASWSHTSNENYEFRAPVTSEIASSDEAMLMEEMNDSSRKQVIGIVHITLSSAAIKSSTQHIIIQGAVTLLLLTLVASWWLARMLTQRLEAIGSLARQTASGDFEQRLTTSGSDEIAQLGNDFNHMLDMLDERDQSLHEQQRIMQTILDQAPISIWMLDRDGRTRFLNRTFSQIWNIDRQRFLDAAHYAELLPPEAAERCMASDQACFSSGEVQTTVSTITDPEDGSTHSFDVIKAPVHNGDGAIEALIGFAIDISPRMEAEAEKAAMQKQVEHTQRLESLGVLAGGIAHDFNNILSAIMGNAALAEQKIKRGTPETCAKHMKNIAEASEKAALLCKQMLAYSGKGQFIITPLNLTTMVNSITSLLEVSISSSIQLEYHTAENLALIEADEAQIQQVIMNLVINASDAISEQNGLITITTGEMDADRSYLSHAVAHSGQECAAGRYVFLEVSDNGCGMDKETQQRLFEPFFTTKFTGRGLGMSAVLGIVRGHHGALMLYSEAGKGTQFKVLFPVSNSSEMNHQQTADIDSESWQGKGTILVIDDEEIIRETAVAMLEDIGFDALTAVDGIDGVETYRQHQQQIVAVLLDMTMPNLNGEGCLAAIKAINPDAKVVLSSGYNEQESTHHIDHALLDGFIQKPYWPDALKTKLSEVLS